MIANFILHFIVSYIFIFLLCAVIAEGFMNIDISDKNNFIKFSTVVFFINLVLVLVISSTEYNRINSELESSTRREDFLYLIKPMYSKIEIDDNNYTYLNNKIETDRNKENDYLICKGQDFFGRNESDFHRNDYYKDFDYKLKYDEYFKILDKITKNLGGYCKVEKDIKYYVKNSIVVPSSKEFTDIDSAKEWIDKKWNENQDIVSIDFKKEIERDQRNIIEDITYKYKIKIPKYYYETLNSFVDSAVIKDKDWIWHDVTYKTPEMYKEYPFLAIIYLEQMLNNKFNVYLSN